MKLFERFDKVFCVNLDRRSDRLENFEKQINIFDLGEFQRVSAIDGQTLPDFDKLNKGELGILFTVHNIIKDSIENDYDSILIMEDDCCFTDEIRNIDSYFNCLPEDWDMLYMGGNHNLHVGSKPPKIINEKVIKLHNTYSAHFVGLKSRVFKEIDDRISKKNKPIDVIYSDLQKNYNVYSFYPAIAKQIISHSDIQNKVVNYDWLIK